MDCNPPGPSVHGILQQEHWSGWLSPPLGGLPNPGLEPGLLCLLPWQVGSLPRAPLGKPQGAVGHPFRVSWNPELRVRVWAQRDASQTLESLRSPSLGASDRVEMGYIQRELEKNMCL